MRQRIQESLSQAKRDKLRDEYDLEFGGTDSGLSPEIENEWLDHVLEFERQFEQAKCITVRERINNPPIQSLSYLPPDAISGAITALLDLLAAHGIAVDFLGDVDELEAYRLQPSPYTGWDVVQTSLLDDLLSYYHNASIGA